MHDWFLQRGRAKLGLAKLLGVIDRWIRRKLQELSFVELWEVRRTFLHKVKELASLDSPHKNPSMGARMRADKEHPFRRYLDREDLRRDEEQEKAGPAAYWGPIYGKLQDEYVVEFLDWKHKNHFWDLDYDKLIRMWRREAGRILPVLPTRAGLPSNSSVRRTPNNREGSGPSGRSPKATAGKAPQASNGETEGQVFHSLEDREIH